MGFLHPWAILAGVAGIGLPVFIHWLTRPRPIRLPLSTIRFVQEILHQRRARSKLRDFIILALRTLAVLLIAFAFARPLIGQRPLVSPDDSGQAVRVVVLDVSQSMAAVDRGMAAIERARAVSADHLQYRSGLKTDLILAAATANSVLDAPTGNPGSLREELARVRPRPERLDIQAALALAARLLSTDIPAGAKRELVIVSDFQKSNWSNVDFAPLPQDVKIQLESVAPKAVLSNLAVLRVCVTGQAQKDRESSLEVEVGNFSPTARDVLAEVHIGDTSNTLRGVCAPKGRTLLTGRVTLPIDGWQSGNVRLSGVEDALEADNSRPFVVNVRPLPTYLLLTREPAGPARLSSYFVARAIDPSRSGIRHAEAGSGTRDGTASAAQAGESKAAITLIRNDPAQLDREQLGLADFILLDHPGPLSADTVRLLASLLRRGRCALYVCGEAVDATNLKLLSDAASPDLKLPVDFAPTPGHRSRSDLRLVDFRRGEAPFSAFGDSVLGTVSPLRFAAAMTSTNASGGLSDEVLALYSDHSAFLVATGCGQGALGILNIDLNESSLPTSPLFVPLMHELIDRLRSGRKPTEMAVCGEPLAIYLPAEPGTTGDLHISSDIKGEQEFGELVEGPGNVLWRWKAASGPGVYRVRHRDHVVFSLATAISGDESDLETIDPSRLQGQMAAGRSVQYRAAADQQRRDDDRWSWLAVACAVCMLGEIIALRLFRT